LKQILWLAVPILILLGTGQTLAQKTYYTSDLYWLRYQNQLIFSPTLYWTNEFDNRRYFSPNLEAQFILHSRIHKKVKKWDFGAGLTYSVQYTNIPENGYREPRHEFRPVVEASHEFPFKKVFVQNRVRIDNRFLQVDPEVPLFDDYQYVMRFRYRLQVRIPIVKNEAGATIFGFKVLDEIMFNSNKNFYDQNRVYLMIDYAINKSLAIETGYIYIDQHAYGREEYYARNVFRFTLTHRINLKR
jgi:hypothetical protein